jgi:hypothetical protein
MIQIAVSEDPATMAALFGKSEVIERLGIPPKLSVEELETVEDKPKPDSWLQAALSVCREIEPLELGLTIDKL